MIKTLLSIILFLVLSVLHSCNTENKKDIYITPRPSELTLKNGVFTINANSSISVENKEQVKIAELFTTLIKNSTGLEIPVYENNDKAEIRLITDNTLTKEGSYILKVTKDNIVIKASSLAGFFYGFQTIRLSLPSTIESGKITGIKPEVPAMSITDHPRFEYRGLILVLPGNGDICE